MITGIGGAFAPQPLSLAATNNLLFIGTTQGLFVYEVSDPGNSQFAGHEEGYPLGAGINEIILSANTAYLASVGLRIVDIADPARPTTVGYVDQSNGGTNGLATDLALSGSYVYLANGADGLRVYDVSNRTSPTNIAHWTQVPEVMGSFPQAIRISGSYAFLANYGDGVRIFDISNPTNLVELRSIPNPSVTRLEIEGARLYVLGDDLAVYDIAFPAKPLLLGRTADAPDPVTLAVRGDYAYIASSGYSFFGPYMYDVSNPANVIRVSPRTDLFNDYPVRAMAINGQYAYIALQFGSSIFDLGKATPPALRVSRRDNRYLELSWPAPSWRYRLQETTRLENPQWLNSLGTSVRDTNNTHTVLVPMDGPRNFFRLIFEP